MGTSNFTTLPLRVLVIMFLYYYAVVSSSSSSMKSISTDRSALVALKAQVEDDHLLATNWSTSSYSICYWIGVHCDSKHQRVTSLHLFAMNLSGTLPPHLGNLSFLASLDLGNNSFHGLLPIELANLRRLKSISLANNNFDGEIPSWFGSLTQLRYLSLDGNNFRGVIPLSWCSNLSKLESLYLSHNTLQGQIPASIENLSSLRFLYLVGNQLSGSIPSSIFNISSLVELYLSSNQLSGSIPFNPLNNMSSQLETIEFEFNDLSGHLPSDLFHGLPKLKQLALSKNQLSGRIPVSLFECKKLEILSLSYNRFQGTIPTEIRNLTMLQILYLSDNNLKGGISEQIGNLTRLYALDFAHNNLTGKIPFEIANLPHLELLILELNSISGHIPPPIFNSSTLRVIGLDSNHLSGSLPSTTGFWLPNLEELYLDLNELHGTIPTSICNSSKLAILEVANNSFSGYIPMDLGNLRHLQVLNLGYNNLASTLSSQESCFLSSLAYCKDLKVLAFGSNPLIDGKLPLSLGNFSISLQRLYAYGCNIGGNIPGEIGNLSNLIVLNIAGNELIGSIPATIARLQKLQGLFLQTNKLEGSIPTELCHLKNLGYLNLQSNKLDGPIPECLGDVDSLRELSLANNKFSNTIPSTFTRLTDILQLNLSSNLLTGALPIDIGKWKVVTAIDFSENQLTSEIPVSIGELQNVAYLSLSGNSLQGSIPQLLGELKGLEFLDLWRNNLSGLIPKSLEKLLYLEYFNVSFNTLQGEVPSNGPFPNYSFQSFLGNEELCGAPRLHLPPCKTKSAPKHSSKLLEYILLPVGSLLVLITLALIVFFTQSRKKNAKQRLDEENSNGLANWSRVSYHELRQATDGFSESELLGVGSIGSVYQGTLSDRQSIAVKVFNLDIEGAFKSFDIECEVLRNIRHRNLVKIITSCSSLDFKALVLEFMPKGSLERWLYSHNYFLDMLQRLNIMIDVASAIEYLHHHQPIPVAHCDLKPSNVLLDEDMVAHLSDFGISKLLGEEESMVQTMTLATIGYMAPEYGAQGIVSIKGDIYSFGILLMEILTRRKPTDEMFVGEMSLKLWVNQSLPSAVIQVVDANLLVNSAGREHSAIKDCAESILQLALECSKELPEERIDMKEVAAKLKKIKIKFLKDTNRRAR